MGMAHLKMIPHIFQEFIRRLLIVKVQASLCEIYGAEVAPVQTFSE